MDRDNHETDETGLCKKDKRIYVECCKSKLKWSTSCHPWTDGQTEWVKRDLQQYLRLYATEKQNSWADWLSLAQSSCNSWIHSAMGKMPSAATHIPIIQEWVLNRMTYGPLWPLCSH